MGSKPRGRVPGGPLRAAVYCRISFAKDDTVKVDAQAALGQQLADQRGWVVAEVYTDNSKSAWQRNRRRQAWDKMLGDVEKGLRDAIIVYHGDRLIRQPWDLEILLRLADEKGIRLASPTGERNLDNPDDRFILRIEAAQACRESDNTSRRLKWHYEKARAEGRSRTGGRGGRSFGFEPDGVTIRQEDKTWIEEVARRIIAGESVAAIAKDISARGCQTTTGRVWKYDTLRKMMCRPRLAGLLVHDGEIVGEAAWSAVLDREQWETVGAILDRKARDHGDNGNARVYLLTGLAKCGSCEVGLKIRHHIRSESLRGYGCVNPDCPRRLRRTVAHLDEYVIETVLTMLNDANVRARLAPASSPDLSGRLRELQETRARRIDEFADDDDMGADIIRTTIRRLDARIAEVRAAMAAAAMPHALDGVWGIDRAGWDALSLDRRRAIVAALVEVTILPARRGPGFDPASVRVIERKA